VPESTAGQLAAFHAKRHSYRSGGSPPPLRDKEARTMGSIRPAGCSGSGAGCCPGRSGT
jgi:hypothetical protein